MIQIIDKSQCCGCSACVQRCPKQCITMEEDIEGFLYPQVDKSLCTDCHLCEKVCPILNQNEKREPLSVYAAKNKNEKERLTSSSGGLFIVLAKDVIQKSGIVFGVVFDDDFRGVHHTYTQTIEGLKPMIRSKYMQSRIETAYVDCERFLKEGREVLFSGTSCQITGLHHFLQKQYDTLLTIDVICHGVPSPKVWRRYLTEEIENARSASFGKNTVPFSPLKSSLVVTGVNFRDKNKFGWKKYGFTLEISASKAGENSVSRSYNTFENPFMRSFLSNLCLRPSCYTCIAKDGCSHSDITIADYWGIQEVMPEYDDDKGTGLLIINTEKGEKVVNGSDFDARKSDLEAAIKYNSSYRKSIEMPTKRETFFLLFNSNSKTFKEVVDVCLAMNFVDKVFNLLRRVKQKITRNHVASFL